LLNVSTSRALRPCSIWSNPPSAPRSRGWKRDTVRNCRGVELTEAGAPFLVEARAVLARVEAAELVLSELSNLKRGTLAVHASQTIAGYWLPRHLVAFRPKYPGIDIRLTIGNTAQGAAAVHEGAADLAFIEGTIEDPMLTKEQVARDQLVIVVGMSTPGQRPMHLSRMG
jgi:DNA-binding transcriptional LysR family regulator